MRSATKILIGRLLLAGTITCLLCSKYRTGDEEPTFPHTSRETPPEQMDAPVKSYSQSSTFRRETDSKEGNVCPVSEISKKKLLPLDDLFKYETEWNEASYNIFLQESSCISSPSYRVWCAVESLAHQNPDARVWYIMTSSSVDATDELVNLLVEKYENLRVVNANLRKIFSDTPLEHIYDSQLWKRNNTWPEINLADIMRLAVVWKLGGLYTDSDVVCIRPLTRLYNMIAWQEGFTLGSGVFHFSRRHPVLKLVMESIKDNFQPEKWGSSGPIVFTKILKELCDVQDKKKRCLGVSLLPMKSFYPIPAVIWKTLFMPQSPRDVRKRYPSSYMIHCWNQMSHEEPIIKNSGCVYDQAAAKFCPITRRVATHKSRSY